MQALRRRWRTIDLVADTADGFRRHRTGRSAALVAHYAFLSVFPLLVVLTTILGFVLQSHPALRADIVDSALAQLPVVGQQIATDPGGLHGNVAILVIGLLSTLWAGMRAFVGLEGSLDDIAEVPLDHRFGLATGRVRALVGIGIVGSAQVATSIITSLAGIAGIGVASSILLVLSAAAVNSVVLGASYRFLCSCKPSWRSVRPGAMGGGVVFAGLQLVGTALVGRAIANASPVYGTFATVIALLSWLALHATVALAGAELNEALARRSRAAAELDVVPAVELGA